MDPRQGWRAAAPGAYAVDTMVANRQQPETAAPLLAGLLISLAGSAHATPYALDTDLATNGLVDIYSATFDGPLMPCGPTSPSYCSFFGGEPGATRNIGLAPDPTQIAEGVPVGISPAPAAGSFLDFEVSPDRATVQLIGGSVRLPAHDWIVASSTTASHNGFGLAILTGGTTTLNAAGQAEFLIDTAPATAIDVSAPGTAVTGCSGQLCALFPIINFDIVRYRLTVDFDDTYSQFTASLIGATYSNSLLQLQLDSATGPDLTPDPFLFIDQFDVPQSQLITSNIVTITGIDAPTPVSVIGGEFSIGCSGVFTAEPGMVTNGQAVCVRHLSSDAINGAADTTLFVGTVSDIFTTRGRSFRAFDDSVSTTPGTSVSIAVMANDFNVSAGLIISNGYYVSLTAPTAAHGSLAIAGTPGFPDTVRIVYTPDPGFRGVDTFGYTNYFDETRQDSAVVTVNVLIDPDADGVDSIADNCLAVANPDQRDTDADGYGNRCDADLNNSGMVNAGDLVSFRQAFGSSNPHADLDGSGMVNSFDLVLFRGLFGKAPGSSAVVAQ